MPIHELSLITIRECIRRHARMIIFGTVLAIIAGIMIYVFVPYKYQARMEFIVKNPMYGDRTVLYNSDSKIYDYFASDEDIDKAILFSRTDIVQGKVIKEMHLATAYGIDSANPVGILKLYKKFDNNLSIVRTEYKDLILYYKDTDPARAVAVADTFVQVLNMAYSDYFLEMRKGMYQSIVDKIHDNDSTIDALTDTLAILRDKYGIYASKYSFLLTTRNKNNDNAAYGYGLERMQNIELLRDGLVGDRAGQITLINHYRTGLKKDELPIIKVVSPARIIKFPNILGSILFILQCGAIGFFFSTIIMLFSDRYFANK